MSLKRSGFLLKCLSWKARRVGGAELSERINDKEVGAAKASPESHSIASEPEGSGLPLVKYSFVR